MKEKIDDPKNNLRFKYIVDYGDGSELGNIIRQTFFSATQMLSYFERIKDHPQASIMFVLQKNIDGQWKDIGKLELDSIADLTLITNFQNSLLNKKEDTNGAESI